MTEYICSLFINVLDLLLSFIILRIYFNTFFEKSIFKKSTMLCWGGYFVWQILLMMPQNLSISIRLFISMLFITFICCIGYKGGILSKIVFAVTISALWTLMEFITGCFIVLFQVDINIIQFSGTVISKILTLILVKMLQKYFKDENIQGLPISYEMILLTIIVGNLIVIYNVFILGEKTDSIIMPITSLCIMLILNILTFRIYFKLAEDFEIKMQNTIYAQHLNLCTQHNKEKETMLLEFRNSKHDFKQHLIILIKYLEENNCESAKEYLAKLVEDNQFHEVGISRSDNIVVDAIVNSKFSKAIKLNIKFEAQVNVPMQLPFENGDISILLGNVLDNAIEASIKVDANLRHIELILKYEKNSFIIVCRNNFNGVLKRNSNGDLMSTKIDTQKHGLGLRSIRKISDKYYGATVYDTNGMVFILKVILYHDS